MGVLFKASFRFWDDTGLSGGVARAGLPAPFPFHEVRVVWCLAASLRPAEEAVCPFVVNVQ